MEQQSVQAAASPGWGHLPAPPDPGWQPPVRSAPWPLPGRCAPARAAGWESESGRCSALPRVVPGLEFWKHRPPFQPSSLLPAGLEDLDIGCQALERFPPALHGATALRRLVLGSSSLRELPPGPYLPGAYAGRPAGIQLAAAAALLAQLWCRVSRTVALCTLLRAAECGCAAPSTLSCYRLVAGLLELDVGGCELPCLPGEALEAATSLTRLVLSRNEGMELTSTTGADGERLHAALLGMPRLRCLEMSRLLVSKEFVARVHLDMPSVIDFDYW